MYVRRRCLGWQPSPGKLGSAGATEPETEETPPPLHKPLNVFSYQLNLNFNHPKRTRSSARRLGGSVARLGSTRVGPARLTSSRGTRSQQRFVFILLCRQALSGQCAWPGRSSKQRFLSSLLPRFFVMFFLLLCCVIRAHAYATRCDVTCGVVMTAIATARPLRSDSRERRRRPRRLGLSRGRPPKEFLLSCEQ